LAIRDPKVRRRSLRGRLALSHFLVACTALAVVALWLPRAVEQYQITNLERRLADEARLVRRLVAPLLTTPQPDRIQAFTQQVGSEVGARVTLIDLHGRVLGDSLHDPATMDNHANRPEIRAALRMGLGQSQRYSHTLGMGRLYIAVPVWRDEGRASLSSPLIPHPSPLPSGVVRLSLSLDDVHGYVRQVRNTLLFSLLPAALAAIGLSLLLARSLTQPLWMLRNAALGWAPDDLIRNVARRSHDEIGELAEAFDRMGTRLKGTIAELARDRSQMRAVLNTMVDGLLVTDAAGQVRLLNPAAARLLGVTAATVSGRTVLDLTLDAPLQSLVDEVLRTGATAVCERSLRTPAERVVAVSAVPIGRDEGRGTRDEGRGMRDEGKGMRDEEEPAPSHPSSLIPHPSSLSPPHPSSLIPHPSSLPLGVVLVFHDLTAARRVERMRRDFVANASHELRTPLASMRVMVETLLTGAREDPEAAQHFLQILDRELQRMTALVNDLLELSRLDARVESAPTESIALAPLAAELEVGWQAVARDRGLRLELLLPEGLSVRGEVQGVRQILANLLDNALKYTPAGGQVHVSGRQEGDHVFLDVSDTGIGIPAADLERIFERFYRVDKDRSRDLGGTGLGLSIVKHLVQTYGGSVAVESRLNRGSTFRVSLPLASGSDSELTRRRGDTEIRRVHKDEQDGQDERRSLEARAPSPRL
jgi:two-component system phosphate regulon sensor histidine kinase PhoR